MAIYRGIVTIIIFAAFIFINYSTIILDNDINQKQEIVIEEKTGNKSGIKVGLEDVGELERKGEIRNIKVASRSMGVNKDSYRNVDFGNFDMRNKSHLTEEDLKPVLKGTIFEGTEKYIIKAEEEYGVNALYIIGIGIQESGWTGSRISREKNNLFSICAFTEDVDSALKFENKEECIMFLAKLLNENYLKESGQYYGGGYSIKHVNKHYAADETWGDSIALHVRYIHSRL